MTVNLCEEIVKLILVPVSFQTSCVVNQSSLFTPSSKLCSESNILAPQEEAGKSLVTK